MGNQDALGATIPQGAAYDIGAFEYRVLFPDPAAARIVRASRQSNRSWRVELSGATGRSYVMESSTSLQTWTTAGRSFETSPGRYEFIDPTAGPARFYRAVAAGLRGP
jgi:hypothetical protein